LPDYSAQIAKIKAAMATGALEVRDGERLVRYRSVEEMLEVIAFLENQTSGEAAGPTAGFAAFDRGDE
jgi:hypothetical protein